MHRKTAWGAVLLGCLALITGGPLVHAAPGDLVWAKSAGGAGFGLERSYGIAVDGTGNALVTGSFGPGNITFGAGEANVTTLTSAGSADVFIAQYAPDGSLRWARSAGDSTADEGRSIAVDGTGNALVTGFFRESATFGAGETNETTLTAVYFSADIFIAKYGPDGTLLWARSAGGEWLDYGQAIAADSDGNALVTGKFVSTATFGAGEANQTALTSVGSFDIFIAKYGPNGTLLWARSAGGTATNSGGDVGSAITVDADGNALVTGYFEGSATFGTGEPNETTLTAAGGEFDTDIFIAQYAPDGMLLWAKSAGSVLDFEGGRGIVVDATGNTLVAGDVGGSGATFGAGEANETTLTTAGTFIAQYASNGTLLWARSGAAGGGSVASAITVDAAGNALVTGTLGSIGATFGAGEANETTLTTAGTFIAQYAPDGTLAWARSEPRGVGGARSGEGRGIAVDGTGYALVTGDFQGFGVFIAKYEGAGTPGSEQPDLVITKRASLKPARVGKELVYTVTVTNQGDGDATKVVVRDWVPANVRVVWMPKRCRLVERGKVGCWLGNLAAGAQKQLRIVVRPKQPGLLVNRAKVKAAETDLNPGDNAVTLRTRVLGSCGYGYDGCR